MNIHPYISRSSDSSSSLGSSRIWIIEKVNLRLNSVISKNKTHKSSLEQEIPQFPGGEKRMPINYI